MVVCPFPLLGVDIILFDVLGCCPRSQERFLHRCWGHRCWGWLWETGEFLGGDGTSILGTKYVSTQGLNPMNPPWYGVESIAKWFV